ncbi:MAG: AI-2E family transporter, partial [Clostridia bacterium]|nr:AI-2E family transporter [Clostridia bacterium]
LSRIPSFLLSLFVSVVAAVWFAADPETPARVFYALPPAWQTRAERVGRGLVRGAKTTFFAYGVLFLVTFLILLLGLVLLGVPYALLLALLIALFDLLPVLGAGGILIPWGIFAILSGRAALGVCVLFLSLVIFTVRQILTPRLVGRGLGVRPLLVFFSVYAGLKLAGAPGMLLGLLSAVPLSRAIDRGPGATDTE